MTEDSLQNIHIWKRIKTHRTGIPITKCHIDNSSSTGVGVFFLSLSIFFSCLHTSQPTFCASKYWQKSPAISRGKIYLGSYATAFEVGKSTQILISQLRSTKKQNACTSFHISLLHILTSLLTDSNNQDTRIHTSAASTSFLKDSRYWFLICCQAGPWNKPENTQETFRKRLEVRGGCRQIPAQKRSAHDCRDSQGFPYPNTSQRDCEDFPTLE